MDQKALNMLDTCNVVWESPSKDSWGSMPLGNGDIGVNFWVEPDGDIVFYISKTDAWSENTRLLKLGKLRVTFDPSPVGQESPFLQTLNLRNGEILVKAGKPGEQLELRLWIDANHPVIQLDGHSEIPRTMQADLELWRTERRELSKWERQALYGFPDPVISEPDTIFKDREDELLWCDRNPPSQWYNLGINKSPEANLPLRPDPLLNRTFGCLVRGDGLRTVSETSLKTDQSVKKFSMRVFALTGQTETLEEWENKLCDIAEKTESLDSKKRLAAHRRWWKDFWTRSWIFIDGDDKVRAVTQGYNLQRLMNACAGRGAQPIKFNGSIFTMDLYHSDVITTGRREKNFPQGLDADFREWNGMFWWQNTRLIYWTLLLSGDYDLMEPFIKTYFNMLPLAKAHVQIHYDGQGAVFYEVIPWWGYNIGNPPPKESGFVTYYFQSGLEMSAIMMNYFDNTQDQQFLEEIAIPSASEIVTFYFTNYPRDDDGKLHIEPAQALETYWEVINPTPVIAGLDFITERLLAIPEKWTTSEQRQQWQTWRKALPGYATRKLNGVDVISPAGTILDDKRHNMENPELYAIFPYQRFGIGHDQLDLAIRTYENRIEKRTGGWFYDCIMAAYVGKAEEAANIVHLNFTVPHAIHPEIEEPMPCRFPNFLGLNYDWVPDQDQPSVAMIALQRMILQQFDKKMLVLPPWPESWDVFFKLHGNYNTKITGEYRNGEMVHLSTSLSDRKADIEVCTE